MSVIGNVIEHQKFILDNFRKDLLLGVEPRKDVDYFTKPFLGMQSYVYVRGAGVIGKIKNVPDNELMKEIWDTAYENTRQSLIATNLYSAIKEGHDRGYLDEDPGELFDLGGMNVYVVTNFETVRGAAAILIREAMEKLWEMIGDFYILPSSVHELIVSTDMPPEDLKDMVREVNDSEYVDEDELLSYNIYRYDHEKKEVVIC